MRGPRREPHDGQLSCTGCDESKPIAEFYRWRGRWQSYCKDCRRARARDWYVNRQAKRRLKEFMRYETGESRS